MNTVAPETKTRLEYQPLSYHHAIRLVKVHAGTGPVSCSLFNTRMLDQEYEALSYTWSDPYPARTKETKETWETWPTILCNNCLIEVTRNLFDFLWDVRSKDELGPFWIDALCINQDDLDERAIQVSFMGDIYSNAAGLLIWLGKEDSATADGVALLSSLATALEAKDLEVACAFQAHDPQVWEYLEYPNPTNIQWRNISSIFYRSWFTRGWVIQEMVLASPILFMCGKVEFSPSVLINPTVFLSFGGSNQSQYWVKDRIPEKCARNMTAFTKMVLSKVHREELVLDGRKCHRLPENKRQGLTAKQEVLKSLEELLLVHRDFQFTDARDQIYAPMALQRVFSSLDLDTWIVPDYRKSWEQVYTDACRFIISNASQLTVFEMIDGQSASPLLPSWVPDFSMPIRISPLTGSYNALHIWPSLLPCSASSNLGFNKKPQIQDEFNNLLELTVKIFDVIESQSGALVANMSIRDEAVRTSEWFDIAAGLPETYSTTGEDRIEVLSRTLIGNRLDEHTATGPWDVSHQFCQHIKPHLLGLLLIHVDIDRRTKEDFWSEFWAYKSLVASSTLGLLPTDVELNELAEYRVKLNKDKTISSVERKTLLDGFRSENVRVSNNRYGLALNRVCFGRRLARTKSGLLCMVPDRSQVGDVVCSVKGGRIPFVLKMGSKDDLYKLVGAAYVHGYMDGEISFPDLQTRTIYLE